MATRHGVGIIGLGVVGQRFLGLIQAHDRLQVVQAYDIDPGIRAAAATANQSVKLAPTAEALIGDRNVAAVYIAVPPAYHHDYAMAAMKAGKVVFCEKPLAIDPQEGRAMAAQAEQLGARIAVNFVYGSATAAERLRESIMRGEMGAVAGMDVRLHFALWPRGWQASATWLADRAQGGFVREVASHFVYLADRLFGAPKLLAAKVHYPAGNAAETRAMAMLECGGIPVNLFGTVGGAGPDVVECIVRGSRRSYRITDWYRLQSSDGGAWMSELDDLPRLATEGYRCQLDRLAELIAGKPSNLPDFRAGLRVQEVIEAILRA